MAAARFVGQRRSAIVAAVLLAIVALGLGLRVLGLERMTLTHAEVYVPRIEMPEWVAAPPPRPTFAATVAGTLHHDNHPPGYYAFMWAWTGLFGTGLYALRLPSALAGAAAIALLFGVARRRDGEVVALTGAGLLALHGHQIFWSQQARMWIFLACLGVLSLYLLQSLHRRYRGTTAAAYVLVVSAGLWLEYSFWPFVAAQMVWEVCRGCEQPELPATARLPLLAVVLSSPVLAFLQVHVAMDRTGYLARTDLLDHVTGFLMLQWLVRAPAEPESFGPLLSAALLALLVAGTLLLIAGVVAAPRNAAGGAPAAREAPAAGIPLAARLALALPPTLLALAWLVGGESAVAFGPAIALPWLLLGLDQLAARTWGRWSRLLRGLRSRDWIRRLTDDPASMHALLPIAILLAASLVVPSVAARSLLFATPFALWLVARGLAALLPRPALRAAGTAVLLLAAACSAHAYARERPQQYDYQKLAAAMLPLLEASDVILINDAWWTQPMHYYLPPDRHRTGDFGVHLRGLRAAPVERPQRVWVVIFDAKDVTAFEALSPYLRGYRERERVTASGAYAVLLERAATLPTSGRLRGRADGA